MLGERWRGTPAARPVDWTRSALGQTGRGSCGESKGRVGGGWRSSEEVLATRNRGGVFAGLRRDGGSCGRGRRGTSLGAQGRYGEYFPSVKMTGRRLPRSIDGGPRDGGYGARWPGYLGPNRLIERAWEQQREVRRLTGWWLVDVDVRKGRSVVGSSAWRRKTSRGSVQRRVHREEARVAL